ncbi:MAG: MBL fold metallo-hydrolase [Coriobacteriia bacterium]|nr:MBL fold metallo-hydrolase [Coriobacteriia bacterium]
MNAQRLVLGELDTNCWIVDDGCGAPAVVIDPAGDEDVLLAALEGRSVSHVVLTHGHFDHLVAVRAVLAATGAPLLVHEADAARITDAVGTGARLFGLSYDAPPADAVLRDGDRVESGGLALEVLHTPGHTEGSICLLGDGRLFAGDTLFAGSIGRTDFPGGSMEDMRRSIAGRLAPLPDETLVHPGHGPDTTIGRERRVNPFFPRA